MNALIKASGAVGKFVLKHSTTILTCTAIVGVGATAYTSGKAAVKANKKLEELEYSSDHKPTLKEKVKTVAPDAVPAIVMGMTTAACIVGAHKLHMRNQAALAMAATAWSTKYKDLNETLVENIGKKKTENLKDKAAQKMIDREFAEHHGEFPAIRTRFGNVLFKDWFSGQYFYSSYEAVDDAIIKLTRELQDECIYVSVNRFYELLEIPTIGAGELNGWTLSDIADKFDGKTSIDITHNRTTQTPDPWCLPCTVIDYEPKELVSFE